MKIALMIGAAMLAGIVLIGSFAETLMRQLFGGGSSQPSKEALADIPPGYLGLYIDAAAVCPGLDWSILAAIGKIESDHGRSTLVGVAKGTQNYAGARGPMQFLQSTFDGVVARHTIPPGGENPPSPWNPHDAIYAAAHYLCDSGARDRRDIRAAIWAYNHADWYVAQVLAQAQRYTSTIGRGADLALSAAAQQAVRYAEGQLGLPYVWGGDGPAHGERGFDCSGLTTQAYASAGIRLPRTAQTQYNAGPLLSPDAPLQPGDLIFYGTPGNVHHVAIYIGQNQIIHAPTFGQNVQIADRDSLSDYVAASRPAAVTSV